MTQQITFLPDQLAAWAAGRWDRTLSGPITGISNDSRTVQPGDLYVAIRGPHWDGHDFIGEAQSRGAVAALVSQPTTVVPGLQVADTARALTAIAAGHRARCRAHIVGITGSVGKTSVKEWMANLLAQAHPVARTHGNWNNQIGLPLSLLRMHPEDAYGVFEIGMSHPGELLPLCELLQPDWGVLTPIGPAHLEHFADLEGIALEKSTLAAAVPPSGKIFLSVDDPWYPVLSARLQGQVIRLSLQQPDADYAGTWQDQTLTVREGATGQAYTYRLPLPGRYVAENALRAIAVAREAGMAPETIRPAVEHYQPPGMRWQQRRIGGLTFINDAYNANPMSMRAALAAFHETPADHGRWVVLGGMLELGGSAGQEHERLGAFVASLEWAGVIAVGEWGRHIATGMKQAGKTGLTVADAPAAAALLQEQAAPGSWVLLKASRGEQLEKVMDALHAHQKE